MIGASERVTCHSIESLAGDARMIWPSLNEAAGRSGCGHEGGSEEGRISGISGRTEKWEMVDI